MEKEENLSDKEMDKWRDTEREQCQKTTHQRESMGLSGLILFLHCEKPNIMSFILKSIELLLNL
jgi:hypothetical protein